jgi:hypothetical protein
MRKLLSLLALVALTNVLSAQSFIGKWARETDVLDTPTSFIVNSNGTFEISRGTVSTRGTYELRNNVIELFDKAGDDMDSVRGLGKYVVSVVGDNLVLKPVEDAAIYRNFILSNVRWSKITSGEVTTPASTVGGGGRK